MMDYADDMLKQLFDEPYWQPEHDKYTPSVIIGIKVCILLICIMCMWL